MVVLAPAASGLHIRSAATRDPLPVQFHSGEAGVILQLR